MEAINPFTERGVIRDPKRFFGRTKELKQIFERLAAMQSVSIVGERRIGKSSLLAFMTATGSDQLGKAYEFHYIDLQRVENTPDFVERVMDALSATGGNTFRALERALENRKVILCLDEFEQAGGFSKEFFGALRSLASTGHLALATASQKKLADLASEGLTTSPFFNIFTSLQLGALDKEESALLLTGLGEPTGRQFSSDELIVAYQETGGNPWKLQIFGYYLYETKDVEEARQRYRAEMDLNTAQPEPVSDRTQVMESPPAMTDGRLPAVLLFIAIVIGFFSIIANFTLGLGLTFILALVSLFVEKLRPRGGSE